MQEPERGAVLGAYTLVRCERSDELEQRWLARRSDSATAAVTIRLRRAPSARAFGTEAELGAFLEHPNILHAREQIDAEPWTALVCDWRPGLWLPELAPSLERLRQASEPEFVTVVVHIAEGLLAALAHAHAQLDAGEQAGIVHGAVQPSAVWIDRSGAVALAGFGAPLGDDDPSRLLDREIGQLRYAAPERVGTRARTPAADVYGVGAILHSLLDGRPYRADQADARAVYQALLAGTVPELSRPVPPQLEALRIALLTRVPAQRPRNPAAIAALLRGWARTGDPVARLAALVTDLLREQAAASDRASELGGPPLLDAPVAVPSPSMHAAPMPAPPMPAPPMPAPPMQVPPRMPSARPPAVADAEHTIAIDDGVLAQMRRESSSPMVAAPPGMVMPPAAAPQPRPAPAAQGPTPVPYPSQVPPARPPSAAMPIGAPPQVPVFGSPVSQPQAAPATNPRAASVHAVPTVAPDEEATFTHTVERNREKRRFLGLIIAAAAIAIAVGVAVGLAIAS